MKVPELLLHAALPPAFVGVRLVDRGQSGVPKGDPPRKRLVDEKGLPYAAPSIKGHQLRLSALVQIVERGDLLFSPYKHVAHPFGCYNFLITDIFTCFQKIITLRKTRRTAADHYNFLECDIKSVFQKKMILCMSPACTESDNGDGGCCLAEIHSELF